MYLQLRSLICNVTTNHTWKLSTKKLTARALGFISLKIYIFGGGSEIDCTLSNCIRRGHIMPLSIFLLKDCWSIQPLPDAHIYPDCAAWPIAWVANQFETPRLMYLQNKSTKQSATKGRSYRHPFFHVCFCTFGHETCFSPGYSYKNAKMHGNAKSTLLQFVKANHIHVLYMNVTKQTWKYVQKMTKWHVVKTHPKELAENAGYLLPRMANITTTTTATNYLISQLARNTPDRRSAGTRTVCA